MEVAENGVVALERLEGEPLPDVIVLDLNMPVMDGFAFRNAQVRDARFVRIPVVVASGGAPAGRSGCLEGVVVTHKPTSIDALEDAITAAMSGALVCDREGKTCSECLVPRQIGVSPLHAAADQ